jgi:hypothetical protein
MGFLGTIEFFHTKCSLFGGSNRGRSILNVIPAFLKRKINRA